MPLRSLSEAKRRAELGVPVCRTHGPGCRKNRFPHPSVWGHKTDTGKWFVTPEQSVETELTFMAEQVEMLRGMPRDDFLAQPCNVEHMPPAEYRKTFGKPSDEELRRLEELTRDVREGYGDAVPEFEEGTA